MKILTGTLVVNGRNFIRLAILCVGISMLFGCATQRAAYTATNDPLEGFNRKVFSFNRMLDIVFFKPFAQIYDVAVPDLAQKGIANFFTNLTEIPIVVNDIFQFEIGHALTDTWRFAFNTTIGVGGLFDVATPFGLNSHYNDLGLTFAKWGVVNTPYFVIPVLGPSTISDTVGVATSTVVGFGMGVGYGGSYSLLLASPFTSSNTVAYSLVGLDFIRIRAGLLPADKLLEEAYDPYVFIRNAYLQRRAYLATGKEVQDRSDTYVEE